MTGEISKIKIYEFTNKQNQKGEIGTFTFYSQKTGYIDCKCFRNDDIEDLKKLNDRDEIEINIWYPKKESWIDKNGIKQYRTCLIVECFESKTKSKPQEQEANNEFNELDWEKEFN